MIKYIVGFIFACVVWIIILSHIELPEYKIYDCGIAEWHPDVPPKVKKECRELKQQEWKKQNEGKVQTNLYEDRKGIRRT